VLLVEDHQMFREWLGQMLCRDPEFSICGEADNIGDAIQMTESLQPDVAIVDLTLRGSSGLELIKNLKARGLQTPVLVLSMHDENLYAERVLRAGGRGYVSKHEASSTLFTALRRILQGEVFLSERMASRLLSQWGAAPSSRSGVDSLADRELEVFQMIGRGFHTSKIASALHLGDSTVETYRARIKDKLGLQNSSELYAYAARWVQEKGL